MGYIVTLKQKNGFFDLEGEDKKVLMTGETLSKFLLKPSECNIFLAVSVGIDEYQTEHSDVEIWKA